MESCAVMSEAVQATVGEGSARIRSDQCMPTPF